MIGSGHLDFIIPEEYIKAFDPTYYEAPQSSFDDVQAIIKEDLGKPLEEIFSEFDPKPIASASLAQVHRAILKSTGKEVAVKIQHRWIRECV